MTPEAGPEVATRLLLILLFLELWPLELKDPLWVILTDSPSESPSGTSASMIKREQKSSQIFPGLDFESSSFVPDTVE